MEHSKEAEANPPPYPGHEQGPTAQPGYSSQNYPPQPGMQPGYAPQQPGMQPGYAPQQPGMQPGYPPQPGMQPGYPQQPGMQPGYSSQPGMYPGYSQEPGTKPGYSPHPGYQPQVIHVTPNMGMGAGTTTVLSPQAGTTIVTVSGFTPFPMNLTCPNCNSQVMTTTNSESGVMTYVLCGALLVLGCWLGCCLIPFCIPDCQDVVHTCPSCKYRLGMYRRC